MIHGRVTNTPLEIPLRSVFPNWILVFPLRTLSSSDQMSIGLRFKAVPLKRVGFYFARLCKQQGDLSCSHGIRTTM